MNRFGQTSHEGRALKLFWKLLLTPAAVLEYDNYWSRRNFPRLCRKFNGRLGPTNKKLSIALGLTPTRMAPSKELTIRSRLSSELLMVLETSSISAPEFSWLYLILISPLIGVIKKQLIPTARYKLLKVFNLFYRYSLTKSLITL